MFLNNVEMFLNMKSKDWLSKKNNSKMWNNKTTDE